MTGEETSLTARVHEERSAAMRRRSLQALAGLALAPLAALQGCGGGGSSAGPVPQPDARLLDLGLPAQPSAWQGELQALVDLLATYHPRPFAYLPRERFMEQGRALMAAFATATQEVAYLGLMRLIAGLRDGHCFLTFPWALSASAYALPFSVFAFEEGVFVTGVEAGRPELAGLAGAELLAYGDRGAATALAAAAAYLPAENAQMALHYGAQALRSGLVLTDAGIAAGPGQVRIQGRRRDGSRLEQVITSGALRELQPTYDGPPARTAQSPTLDFWAQWLGETVFYLRYRRCRDAAGFESLVREHLGQARFPMVRRVVVDVRGNGGGDSSVIQPLVEGLRQLEVRGARLVVLSDRSTLSAAVDAILDLKALGALHAGEAPGQRPNFNGNVRVLTTPSGRLSLNLPTTYQPRLPGDPEQLVPDLQRPLRVADWLAQRDPLLDEVLAL